MAPPEAHKLFQFGSLPPLSAVSVTHSFLLDQQLRRQLGPILFSLHYIIRNIPKILSPYLLIPTY